MPPIGQSRAVARGSRGAIKTAPAAAAAAEDEEVEKEVLVLAVVARNKVLVLVKEKFW